MHKDQVAKLIAQLSSLVHAGLDILQCTELLAKSAGQRQSRALLAGMATDLAAGLPLHQAMRKHPKIFDSLACDMVAIGESSGQLDTMLQQLSTHMQKMQKIRKHIRAASIYPLSVLLACGLLLTVFLLYVIPSFAQLYQNNTQGNSKPLPALTQYVFALSTHFQSHAVLGLLLCAGALVLWRSLYQRAPVFRLYWDAALLHLPLVGGFLHRACLARWAQTSAVMLAAGTPLLDTFSLSGSSGANMWFAHVCQNLCHSVQRGQSLALAMQAEKMDAAAVQMVYLGERAGNLDAMLTKLAQVYQEELEAAFSSLAKWTEPLIILFLGVLVGTMVLALYLPIFELGQTM